MYSPCTPLIVRTCPPTARSRRATLNSTPSRYGIADSAITFAVNTVATSGCWAAKTTCDSCLIIPDLVRAISSKVSPRYSVWSNPIGVITETWLCTTFVASHSPPIPTSMMPISTGNSANATKASAVIASKNEIGCGCFESTRSR